MRPHNKNNKRKKGGRRRETEGETERGRGVKKKLFVRSFTIKCGAIFTDHDQKIKRITENCAFV